MIAAIRLLNLAQLRQHPIRAGLTVLAIGAGVGVFVAVLVAQASLEAALASFDEQRSGPATLQVLGSSDAGIDGDVLPRVEDTDGVAAAVPLVQSVVLAVDDDGEETIVAGIGVDCRVEAIVDDLRCSDAGLQALGDEPFVSPQLREIVGDDGVLRTNLGPVSLADAAVLEQLGDINNGRVVVFSMPRAQELFSRPDTYDLILVVPEPGVSDAVLRERLADRIGRHNQLRATGDWDVAQDPILPTLFLLGLLCLGLGGQLAHNAMALALEARRSDFATAAAVGAPGRLLLAGTLVEASVVGLAGGVLGVLVGVVAAQPMVDSMTSFLERMTGVQAGAAVPVWVIAAGVLLGVGVAVVSSIRPALRAVRADTATELRARGTSTSAAPPPWRLRTAILVGVAAVGMGLAWLGQRDDALQPWQPVVAQVGLVMTTLFLLRACRHVAAPLVGRLGRRWPRGLLAVAVDNLAGDPRRTGTMTLVVAATVTIGVAVGGAGRAVPSVIERWVTAEAVGTVQISNGLQINTGGLAVGPSPAIRDRVEEVPGVDQVTGAYAADVHHPLLGAQEVMVRARDGQPHPEFPLARGGTPDEVLQAGDVLIGPEVARAYGLEVGDRLRLPGVREVEEVRVGAILAEDGELGESVTIPYELFERLFGKQTPLRLYVTPAPGVDQAQLADRIETAIGDLDPYLVALTPDEVAARALTDTRRYMSPFRALQRALLLVAALAALSTLLLVGIQRRREYGVLAAVGLSPRALGGMVVLEAGIVGLLGTLLGSLVGTAVLVVLRLMGSVGLGFSAPFHLEWREPLTYGLLTTLCVVAAAVLPARRAARLDPVAALRYE